MRKQTARDRGGDPARCDAGLSACGSAAEAGSTGGGGSDDDKVAKIGVIAPLSGDLSALGLGIQNSVDLAIKQANENERDPGLDARDRRRGRRGQARRRQERRHQAGR